MVMADPKVEQFSPYRVFCSCPELGQLWEHLSDVDRDALDFVAQKERLEAGERLREGEIKPTRRVDRWEADANKYVQEMTRLMESGHIVEEDGVLYCSRCRSVIPTKLEYGCLEPRPE